MKAQLFILGIHLGPIEQRTFIEVRSIPSWPVYLAGDDGSIWSSHRNRLRKLKAQEDRDGYLRLNLSIEGELQRCRVHSLVAAAFIRKIEEGEEVNHVNADKSDNMPTNLEITTCEGNAQHAYKLGLLFPIGAWNRRKAELKRIGVVISSEQDEGGYER